MSTPRGQLFFRPSRALSARPRTAVRLPDDGPQPAPLPLPQKRGPGASRQGPQGWPPRPLPRPRLADAHRPLSLCLNQSDSGAHAPRRPVRARLQPQEHRRRVSLPAGPTGGLRRLVPGTTRDARRKASEARRIRTGYQRQCNSIRLNRPQTASNTFANRARYGPVEVCFRGRFPSQRICRGDRTRTCDLLLPKQAKHVVEGQPVSIRYNRSSAPSIRINRTRPE